MDSKNAPKMMAAYAIVMLKLGKLISETEVKEQKEALNYLIDICQEEVEFWEAYSRDDTDAIVAESIIKGLKENV